MKMSTETESEKRAGRQEESVNSLLGCECTKLDCYGWADIADADYYYNNEHPIDSIQN